MHARKGLRESYAPLATHLCPKGDPFQLADTLLSIYPFKTVYLADLDALMARGSNQPLIRKLVSRHPETTFWLDQGVPALGFRANANHSWIPVIGSESLNDSMLKDLSTCAGTRILSLDFMASALKGPATLLENDALWPESVILMNLDRVGCEAGPPWERLSYFKRRWPHRRFIAAGGVRHAEDLNKLAEMGFSGALIASALHRGGLGAPVIESLASEKTDS